MKSAPYGVLSSSPGSPGEFSATSGVGDGGFTSPLDGGDGGEGNGENTGGLQRDYQDPISKRAACESILQAGYVQSFVDFFYLTHRPDPKSGENTNKKVSEEGEEGGGVS